MTSSTPVGDRITGLAGTTTRVSLGEAGRHIHTRQWARFRRAQALRIGRRKCMGGKPTAGIDRNRGGRWSSLFRYDPLARWNRHPGIRTGALVAREGLFRAVGGVLTHIDGVTDAA